MRVHRRSRAPLVGPGALSRRGLPGLGIRSRLLLLFAVLCVPATAVITHDFLRERSASVAAAMANLRTIASRTSAALRNDASGEQRVLRAMAHLPALLQRDAAGCQRVVADLMRGASTITTIAVTDAAGTAWCESDPAGVGKNYADRDYFRIARESGGTAIGMPVVGRVSGRPVLPLAAALRDVSGQFAGVVRLGVDLQWLGDRVASFGAADLEVILWSPDGTVLYRQPGSPTWLGRRPAGSGIGRAVIERRADTLMLETTGLDGRPALYAVVGLEGWFGRRLSLSVGERRDSVTLPIDHDLLQALGWLAGVTALALLIGFLWAETGIRRPIAALIGFSKRLATGDLKPRISARRLGGEIGELADSLEAMRAALARHHDGLEELVAQRTAALEAEQRKSSVALETMPDACAIYSAVRDAAGAIAGLRREYLNAAARAQRPAHSASDDILPLDAAAAPAEQELFRQLLAVLETGQAQRIDSLSSGRLFGDARAGLYDLHVARLGDGLIAIGRDVTEQQRMAREHQLILQTALDGFWIVGDDGRFLEVNDAYCAMTGYARGELLAMRIGDLEADESRDAVARHVEKVRREGSDRFETRHRRRDGALIDVEVSTQLSGARENAFIVFIKDITATKRMERELREFNARLTAEVQDRTAQLRNTNRMLRTLSTVNGALVRAQDETGLFDGVCGALIEVGGYRLAWIALAEDDAAKTVRPVARRGDDRGYLATLPYSWAEETPACPSYVQAVRSGASVFIHDTQAADAPPCHGDAARHGFLSLASLPLRDGARVLGALTLYSADAWSFSAEEVALLEELAGDVGYGVANLRNEARRAEAESRALSHLERLNAALESAIAAIALTIEKRDPYTAGHQRRVADLASSIGREMGLEEERVRGILFGGLIHDIGKIYVPAEILNRPGRLSEHELAMIKTHPQIGHEIVKGVAFPWPVAEIVLQHHERLDGSGYPKGLSGGQILPEARILAVADVVEAISSHRPYRAGLGLSAGIDEILRGRGSAYDPEVVDACVRIVQRGYAWGQ